MKLVVILSLISFLSACTDSNATNKTLKVKIDDYKKTAVQLVESTKLNADHKKISDLATDLLGQADAILKLYSKKNPKCAKMLNVVLAKAEYMTSISLEKIEKDFHDGEALPEVKDGCHDAKELVVHPATVVIVTKTPYDKAGKEQILDEIEEVVGHIDNLLLDENVKL